MLDSVEGQTSSDDSDAKYAEKADAEAMALIAEHLEIADRLRAAGEHEDADALVAIAQEMAEELSNRLSEAERHSLCRPPAPPQPIVVGDVVEGHLPHAEQILFQSPWLRSSGSSGGAFAPLQATRAPFALPMSATPAPAPAPAPPRQESAVPPDAHFSRRFLPSR
jgi:hypothetical protein